MAKKSKTVKVPAAGEQTIIQQQGLGTALGMTSSLTSLYTETGDTPPGNYKTYRKMRGNPTTALARMAAGAPIKASTYAVEMIDGAKDEWREFISEQLEGIWPLLIRNMLFALDYGWQSFEKVWGEHDGKWIYTKIKPLMPDVTKIIIDPKTGVFGGIRQKGVELPPEKVFVYSHNMEYGNFYGRSRHENIRENAWWPWCKITERLLKYASKTAGIIPMIQYPPGKSLNKANSEVANSDIADLVLRRLGDGHGVTMPNTLAKYALELSRQGVDPGDLKAWQISFLEAKGRHGMDFVAMMRHYEALIVRGWLVPERAILEGQHGTKAEAGVHTKVATLGSSQLFDDMLRQINWYIINPLLLYNFGPDAENKVYVINNAMDPGLLEFLQGMMKEVLSNPANVDLFIRWLDIDQILDTLNLPKSAETVADLEAPVIPSASEKDQPGKETDEQRGALSRVYKGVKSWMTKK